MPWLSETMKDASSCDKLRGGAENHYIRRFPNGETCPVYRTQMRIPAELKHLSKRRKRKQFSDSLSSGERKGNSPNHIC